MLVQRRILSHVVYAECSDSNARRAASVLREFENVADAGVSMRAGTAIRFGWSLLRLQDDGRALRVSEPDFARWPETCWNPSIDRTLDVLAQQTALLQEFDVDGEDVFFDQTLIADQEALLRPDIFLKRTSSSSADDSGWLLGPIDDPDALAIKRGPGRLFIAELVEQRPSLLQALVLPIDYIVRFSGDSLRQVFDGSGRKRLPEAGT